MEVNRCEMWKNNKQLKTKIKINLQFSYMYLYIIVKKQIQKLNIIKLNNKTKSPTQIIYAPLVPIQESIHMYNICYNNMVSTKLNKTIKHPVYNFNIV